MKKINNFVKIDSQHGPFILNRHCAYAAQHMIKTGQTHIEAELNNILEIAKLLPQQCVVVDAGANVGMVTIPLAQAIANRKGVVHAFEAQRMIAYALSGAVALNDLENVFVYNKALGSSCRTLSIETPDYAKIQDFGMYSLTEKHSQPTTQIEQVTIDSLNLPQLDFLKIDVEGMDIEVLKGAQQSLKAHQPWCWVEYWKLEISDIKQQFSSLDYDFYMMDKLNLLAVPLQRAQGRDLTINAKKV